MRVLLIGADRTPAALAEARLSAMDDMVVERMPRIETGPSAGAGAFDAAVIWHELLEALDRASLRDYATLSRRMPIVALMSLGDWTGGRPGAVLADGWIFIESNLLLLPEVVRLASAGYWTAPDALVGPNRDGLRRRQAMHALSVEQLKVLDQLAAGLTNRDIARRLDLPEPMVKKTVHDIITRLGLANRTQAAVMALSVSLGRDGASVDRTLAKRQPQCFSGN